MLKEKIQQSIFYHRFKKAYVKYERFFMPATLLAGLVLDFLTFKTLEIQTSLLILSLHYLFAGFLIAYRHLFDAKVIPHYRIANYLRIISPVLLQFSFGALLSASFVFYWFSGTISVSWPFIGLLAFLMLANDVFREYYNKPLVQIAVYYFISFSFFALALPFLANSLSPWLFGLAGLLSLLIVLGGVRLISKGSKTLRLLQFPLQATIGMIFLGFNIAYFANIIPPIPLSLRDAGVYHSVKRQANNYLVQEQKSYLWQRIIPGSTIHLEPGKPAFVFSSIFAPAKLSTPIIHHWQFYDEVSREWKSQSKLSFDITGGRQDGYRGYTLRSNLQEGLWRVDIETERGQVLGTVRFRVELVDEQVELIDVLK